VADQTGLRERSRVDLGNGGIELREVADVDHRVGRPEVGVVETTVRQLAVERHLAALEAGTDAAARARRLALAAAAAGLAVAAAFSATDPFAPMDGALDVGK